MKPQQALTQQEMTEVTKRRSKDEVENVAEERIEGIGYQRLLFKGTPWGLCYIKTHFSSPSRRAQAMFMGSKTTTNKEGATIFEVRNQFCLPHECKLFGVLRAKQQ